MYETLKDPDLIIAEKRENQIYHLYIKSYSFTKGKNKKKSAIQTVTKITNGELISTSTHGRTIPNRVNTIKNPDQLLYVATKVRDLIERRTGNHRSEISSVHKPNPLETKNVSIDSEYTKNKTKSTENNKKLEIKGDIKMGDTIYIATMKDAAGVESWNGEFEEKDLDLAYITANNKGRVLKANDSMMYNTIIEVLDGNIDYMPYGVEHKFENIEQMKNTFLENAKTREKNAFYVRENYESEIKEVLNTYEKENSNKIDLNTFKQENPWYFLNGQEGILTAAYYGKTNFYPFDKIENLENGKAEKTYDEQNLSSENYGKAIIYADVRDFEDKRKLVDRFVTEDFYKEDLYERELCVETNEEYDWNSDLTSFKEFIVNKVQSGSEINKEELSKEWQKINDKYSLPIYSSLEGSAPSIDAILKGVALLTEIKMSEEEVSNVFKQLETKIDVNTLNKTDDWKIATNKPYVNAPATHQVYKLRYPERPDSEFNRVVIGELSSKDNATQFINQVEKYTHERENSTDLKTLRDLTNVLEKNETMTVMHPELGEILVEAGETGKSGYGLKHIIEQRYSKDNKTIDDISAITKLVIDSTEKGKNTREDNKIIELEKDGIIAIIRHKNTDKNSPWVLTGYASWDKEKEATDAIKTVNATYSYTPEYSHIRNQVGAVIASLDKEYTNNQEMSSKKDLELEAKNKQGEKKMSDMTEKLEPQNEGVVPVTGATEKKPYELNTASVLVGNVKSMTEAVREGTAPFMMGEKQTNGDIIITPSPAIRSALSGKAYPTAANMILQNELHQKGIKDNAVISFDQAKLEELGTVGIRKGANAINLSLYNSKNEIENRVGATTVFPVSQTIKPEEFHNTKQGQNLIAEAKMHNQKVSFKEPIEAKNPESVAFLSKVIESQTKQCPLKTDEKTLKAFSKNFTSEMDKALLIDKKPSQFYSTINKASWECKENMKQELTQVKAENKEKAHTKDPKQNSKSKANEGRDF